MNTLTHTYTEMNMDRWWPQRRYFFFSQQIVHLLHKTALHWCLHSVTLVGTGGYTDGHWPLVMLRDAQTCEGIRNQSMYNLTYSLGRTGGTALGTAESEALHGILQSRLAWFCQSCSITVHLGRGFSTFLTLQPSNTAPHVVVTPPSHKIIFVATL